MVAVYLHHVLGWTAKEIGEYLGCAESTASVHIHRGIKRLRDDLHPTRYRLRTSGKISLAALVGGALVDQLARVSTHQLSGACSAACHQPHLPHLNDVGGATGAIPLSMGLVLLIAGSLFLVWVKVARRAEPQWRAIRRRRHDDGTGT
jgi:hypothetical protein